MWIGKVGTSRDEVHCLPCPPTVPLSVARKDGWTSGTVVFGHRRAAAVSERKRAAASHRRVLCSCFLRAPVRVRRKGVRLVDERLNVTQPLFPQRRILEIHPKRV